MARGGGSSYDDAMLRPGTTAALVGLFAALLAAPVGCAHIQEQRLLRLCSWDGAVEEGIRDARGGVPYAEKVATLRRDCPLERVEEAVSGYRAGYARAHGRFHGGPLPLLPLPGPFLP